MAADIIGGRRLRGPMARLGDGSAGDHAVAWEMTMGVRRTDDARKCDTSLASSDVHRRRDHDAIVGCRS
jgi:hypothetical protein